MLYVSIFVELLRSRPALAVWIAALAQAALWTLVPTLFYAGPPGDVPFVLAIGNELQLGTYLGPPLAFWLAEVAYVAAGNSLFGVYLLSQICVVVTYWCGVRARPFDRRRAARGAGGAADGRHLVLHGADAGFRSGHADHGAVGGHPAALLARGERGQARLLGRACRWRSASCSSPPMPGCCCSACSRCSRPPTSAPAPRCVRPIRGLRASSPSSCCSRICFGCRRPATA